MVQDEKHMKKKKKKKKKTYNGIDDFFKKIIAGQYSCIFSKFSSFKAMMSKKNTWVKSNFSEFRTLLACLQ